MEPEHDDDLILPPEELPSDAVPVGVILDDDSVVDLHPGPSAVQ